MTRQIDPNQYTLDFESSGCERRALLIGALIAAGATRLQQLALLVHGHQESHQGQPLEISAQEIAAELRVSHITARRRIASLVKCGILRQERRAGETSRLAIYWQGVRTIATSRPLSSSSPTERRPGTGNTTTRNDARQEGESPPVGPTPWGSAQVRSTQLSSAQLRSAQPSSAQAVETTSSLLNPIKNPPSYLPTPHQEAPYRVESLAAGWREVGRVLWHEWKIGLAAQAVSRFEVCGGTLEELQAIVAYAREHGAGTYHAAWGPGAIYRKIFYCEPGEPLDVGWPKPSAAWERHERRTHEEAKRAANAQERATPEPIAAWPPLDEVLQQIRHTANHGQPALPRALTPSPGGSG